MALLIIIFLFYSFLFIKNNKVESAINYLDELQQNNTYYLDFSNELLTTRNLKLKIAPFTGYEYKVNKIYPKYYNKKEYYSYNFKNIDLDIDNFTNEYIMNLKNNYNFNEIDKVKQYGIKLIGIEIYAEKEAINYFKNKYPNVKIIPITNKNNKK